MLGAEGQPVLVLDLRDRFLGQSAGWLDQQEFSSYQKRALGLVQVSRWSRSCSEKSLSDPLCRRDKTTSPIDVAATKVADERIVDAGRILELINRPLTGAEYNRSAEQRIMQWRSTLSNALVQARQSSGYAVALCIAITRVKDGTLQFAGNELPADEIPDLEQQIIARTDGYVSRKASGDQGGDTITMTVGGSPAIMAAFRQIRLVDTPLSPQIDFAIGGETVIEVPSKSAEPAS